MQEENGGVILLLTALTKQSNGPTAHYQNTSEKSETDVGYFSKWAKVLQSFR